MIKIFFLLALLLNISHAANEEGVDCLIIEEENSIICKYTHDRITEDKTILVNWIEPNGKITRSRDMVIPAGHGSIYDFRYLQGRTLGEWTFQAIDNGKEFTTNFTLK